VVDVDEGKGKGDMENQDFLGRCEVTLSKIFTSRGQTHEAVLPPFFDPCLCPFNYF